MLSKFLKGLDDLTPKAERSNPFDSSSTPNSRKGSISSTAPPSSGGGSGARTPRAAHESNSSSTSFFGPFTPGLTPGAVPVTPGGVSTTAVTMAEPDFSFTSLPSSSTIARKKETAHAPKGKLSVKLISARSLSSPHIYSRPYVVVSFDQNEFISREPIHEEGEEVTGIAGLKKDNVNRQNSPMGSGGKSVLPDLTGGRGGSGGSNNTSGTSTPTPSPSTPTTSNTSLSPLNGKISSGLGRSLETYRNGIEAASSSASASAALVSNSTSIKGSIGEEGEENEVDMLSNSVRQIQLSNSQSQSAYNPTWKHEVFFDVMNEKSVIQVQIFDRSVEEEMFLGMTEIRPRLVNGHTVDQWFSLVPRSDEQVTGDIRIQIRYEKFDVKKGLVVNDFDFLRMIGKGTFGRVFQVRKKDTRRIYAMKVLSKREIVAKKEVAHTIGERKILQKSSDSPFLLGLKFSFQSETDLYLIMDYKSGGELFHHLQKEGRFTEDRARFYTAEIVLAFEHLHNYDIVYRDLKPENILLDATGHIVLCDFGLSKPDLPSDALTNTFCGTTEYLAPEILLDDHGYSKLVDFWSLGVLLFEMCCGWSPFYAEDTQQMYKLICFGKVKFPRGVIGENGKQFVKGLLNRNPKHRLGATRDAAELKEHPFFETIDWLALSLRQIPPPFKPYVDSDESVANFDPEFTEANLFDEAPDDVLFDEEDRSDDWLDAVSSGGNNGGGGGGGRPGMGERSESGPVQIIKQRRPPTASVAPLTQSIQENFRGFTFSGQETMIHNAGLAHASKFAMTAMENQSSMARPPTPPRSSSRSINSDVNMD